MGGNIDAKKAYAAFRNYQKENPTFSDKQIMEELDFSKEQEHMVNTLLYMNSPLSLQMDIGNDPGQEALLEEIIPDGRDDYLELENKLSNSDVLNSLKKNLTEEEFEFLSDLYLKNYKDTAYAKEKNVSKQAVNTRKIRILRKLKSPSVNHRLRQDLGVPDDMPNDKIISYLYER
jgi:DNA-directed RNA polymerase sigma subunit (sigma70/sigma32)